MAFANTIVRNSSGADCDTDHNLVVAKIRIYKEATQNLNGERFNLRKLNELEVGKEYGIENTNNLAALKKLSVGKDINKGWGTLKSK